MELILTYATGHADVVVTRRPVILTPINDRLYVGLVTPPGYVLRTRLTRFKLYTINLLYPDNDTTGTGGRVLLIPDK